MRLLYTMILLSVFGLVESQPYYNTSIPNKFVSENAFLTKTIDTSALPIFANIKYKLPQPYWPSRPDALRCYWFAWEIAFRNTLKPIPQSGFLSPFIDAAFNGNLLCGIPVLCSCLDVMAFKLLIFNKRSIIFMPSNIPMGSFVARLKKKMEQTCFTKTTLQVPDPIFYHGVSGNIF